MTTDLYSIAYEEKSFEDLFLLILQSMYSNGLLSDDSQFESYVANYQDLENTLILHASVYAYILSEVYIDLTRIYRSSNLWEAADTDLDIIGQMFLPRRGVEYAVTEVVYSVENPNTFNVIIPEGSVVESNTHDAILFQTMSEVILPAGSTSITVGVQCLSPGLGGNVGANTLIRMGTEIDGIDSVTNPTKATGGRDIEGKESYRNRLLNWKYLLESGTYDAIVNAINGVSPVTGFYIHRFWDGRGTTKIIIDPPLSTVIGLVEDALELVKAVDEDYYIVPVELLTIDINMIVNVTLDSSITISQTRKNEIKELAESLVEIYVDGGYNLDGTEREALGIGNDFIPFKCGMYLSTQIAEIKNVTFTSPSTPTTIESHEKAVAGNISIRVE